MSKTLYFDYAASSPLDTRVRDVMLPWLDPINPGNAHARHHAFGTAAGEAVKTARMQIATTLNTSSDHIIFTSGATESNNLALQGFADSLKKSGRTHIISSLVEHQSILKPLERLKAEGFTVTLLPVKPCGMVEADSISRALTPQTGLVSIQLVNNETGTIQPISEIAAALHGRDIILHCDAAQALGKMTVDFPVLGADLLTLSAHKVYGPQGIGALCASPAMQSRLSPLHEGSGHENGLRSGTLPVALIAGFGVACALASDIHDERARLQILRNQLLHKLSSFNPFVHGHSDPQWNAPGILNLRFAGIDSEALIMALPGLAFSAGSACGQHGSHVIRAITGSKEHALESIRLSFGRMTTDQDIDNAASQISDAVQTIRKMQEAA